MTVQRKRSGSVVSGSRGGSVVSGSHSAGGGRIIGEVLSGGRNVSGVAAKKRAAPRPTKDSARHSLRPAPKAVTAKHDDYSDFGFDEWPDDWDDDDIETQGASAHGTRYGGVATQPPQSGASAVSGQYHAAVVLGTTFRRLFILGMFYIILFMAGMQFNFAFLRVALIPMALTIWCGTKAGAAIKRGQQSGMNPKTALTSAALCTLLIGVWFFAVVRFIGFYPTFMLVEGLGLPYTLRQYADIIDMGIFRVFDSFRMATYAVVPFCGIVLGWIFGRR